MVYDRESLAELLRRTGVEPCRPDCGPHHDHADRLAAHALDELEDDISNYVNEQILEDAAGEDL